MKNVFVLFGLALLVGSMMFVAQPADAAIATSYLRMSQLNVMEDLDYESFDPLRNLGDSVEDGDVLYGMWVIEKLIYEDDSTQSVGPPYDTFTVAFAAMVESVVDETRDGINGKLFTFVPVSDTVWDTVMDTATNTQLARADSGSFIKMFSDPDGIDATAGTDEQDALATVNGIPLWEFGFTGTDGAGDPVAAGNEFWEAFANTDVLIPAVLAYGAALNVTEYYPSGLPLLEFDHYSGNLTNLAWKYKVGMSAQMQIEGGNGTHGAGEFVLPTETDIAIKPIPEPGSVLIWGGIVAIGAMLARRRRQSVA